MTQEKPFNTIPPVIVVLALVIVAVEAVLGLARAGFVGGAGGLGWRILAYEQFGFAPSVWELMIERGVWTFDLLKRFVTYAFVQQDFVGAMFAGAMLLALGKFVGEVFHWTAVLAIVGSACVFGALVFGILAPTAVSVLGDNGLGRNPPLIGAFPMVYGLIGAFTYLMWLKLGQLGQNQLAAFRLIGFLLAIQLVFGILFGAGWTWIADLGGFAAGLAVAPFVAPGGWAAFVRRMRAR